MGREARDTYGIVSPAGEEDSGEAPWAKAEKLSCQEPRVGSYPSCQEPRSGVRREGREEGAAEEETGRDEPPEEGAAPPEVGTSLWTLPVQEEWDERDNPWEPPEEGTVEWSLNQEAAEEAVLAYSETQCVHDALMALWRKVEEHMARHPPRSFTNPDPTFAAEAEEGGEAEEVGRGDRSGYDIAKLPKSMRDFGPPPTDYPYGLPPRGKQKAAGKGTGKGEGKGHGLPAKGNGAPADPQALGQARDGLQESPETARKVRVAFENFWCPAAGVREAEDVLYSPFFEQHREAAGKEAKVGTSGKGTAGGKGKPHPWPDGTSFKERGAIRKALGRDIREGKDPWFSLSLRWGEGGTPRPDTEEDLSELVLLAMDDEGIFDDRVPLGWMQSKEACRPLPPFA